MMPDLAHGNISSESAMRHPKAQTNIPEAGGLPSGHGDFVYAPFQLLSLSQDFYPTFKYAQVFGNCKASQILVSDLVI